MDNSSLLEDQLSTSSTEKQYSITLGELVTQTQSILGLELTSHKPYLNLSHGASEIHVPHQSTEHTPAQEHAHFGEEQLPIEQDENFEQHTQATGGPPPHFYPHNESFTSSTEGGIVHETFGYNFSSSSHLMSGISTGATESIQAPYPDHESMIPPSGAYLPPSIGDDVYDEEDEQQAFGPGTCRYGGKVYVSAQQIPRDDPCDFCFCFRSDIICLQQSCPPPIQGCREEPIDGFCCPRYECPVSMAAVMNISTTTTTTTTTLPPHFFTHAYTGSASMNGCQVSGKAYKVGDVVESASGPCLQCRCGGDGQMRCDPQVCNPQPMLKKMILAAASRRR
ncbi:unnamed protein product [Timema podura]|uniref:VWFC domain-containing protein n=1 Tax=Timema podura TaxID=61482 RepID=A0ABN7P9W9_TIMPD|nr:unnamed protein product [Timema podura]